MEAVQKVSAVQQVEERIREYILQENVHIGDKLPTERELCEALNVGRGTVREAIRVLQAKGLVDLQVGRGAFVAGKDEHASEDIANWFRMNEVQVMDLIEIRNAIEPLAVRLAIQRMSDKELNRLIAIHDQSKLAAEENNAAALAKCDEKFHACIMESSHNKALVDINRIIVVNLANFRGKTFTIPSNVNNFIPAHTAILNAIRARDIAAGEEAMRVHLEAVAADLENSKTLSE